MADLDRAAARWRDEGWVLIEGLIDEATIAAVQAEIADLPLVDDGAGRPSQKEFDDSPERGPAFRNAQFTGTRLFPVPGAPTLNRLTVDRRIVGFARRALAVDDLRLYQARLWSKRQGRVDYEQPLHRDLNHSLVPTRSEPGWWHLECFLYLTDVDLGSGAPRLVPRSAGVTSDRLRPVSAEEVPELYGAEVAAVGGPGSLLAYRSDVWHRGTDITRPGAERHVLVVAYRPAALEWIGYDPFPPLAINRSFSAFVADSTPEDLALFGFPPPGHPYWTAAMVDGLAHLYPGLDIEPWRAALG
ncbi:MAG: phytanoyl-CoA dioxygenase family protein [Acidimicrobiales bacterium]